LRIHDFRHFQGLVYFLMGDSEQLYTIGIDEIPEDLSENAHSTSL